MTPAKACAHVAPYVSLDKTRENLSNPWTRRLAGKRAIVASDGGAVVWVWAEMSDVREYEEAYLTKNGTIKDRDSRVPDPFMAAPFPLFGTDVTEELRKAYVLTQALPKLSRTRARPSKKFTPDLCHVVHITPGDVDGVETIQVSEPNLPRWRMDELKHSPLMIYAHYIAHLPGSITRATWYQWRECTIVETDLGGALIMSRLVP
jgi:hypothetical protein